MTPWTRANQAPLSMGILQAGYWSGLPCPPPGDFPNPGIEPRSFALQADSLPAEPPGKPQEYWSGQPSLLWGIFPTQESNLMGSLHCRQILYQLSYQESPLCYIPGTKYYLNQLEYACVLSHAQLIGAPCTVAPQALLSLEFPI